MADKAALDTQRQEASPMGPQEMRNWANNLIEFPDFRHTPAMIEDFGRSVLSLLDRIEELQRQQEADGKNCATYHVDESIYDADLTAANRHIAKLESALPLVLEAERLYLEGGKDNLNRLDNLLEDIRRLLSGEEPVHGRK